MRSFGRRKVKEGGNKLGKLFPPCLERTPNFARNCGAKKDVANALLLNIQTIIWRFLRALDKISLGRNDKRQSLSHAFARQLPLHKGANRHSSPLLFKGI